MAHANSNKNGLTAYNGLVSIGQAAEMLGVSIDTVRRWDKAGKLRSTRPDGKNRYFTVESIDKKRQESPLKISEAAEHIGVSTSTLRRLEKRGLLKPQRNKHGERLYQHSDLERLAKPAAAGFEQAMPLADPSLLRRLLGRRWMRQANEPAPVTAGGNSLYDKAYGDSVFTWFIAVYAIVNGASQFLFPWYTQSIRFESYLTPLFIIKSLMILFGALYLLTKINGARYQRWNLLSGLAIVGLFLAQAFIFYVSDNPINMVSSSLVALAFASVFLLNVNEFVRYCGLVAALTIGTGTVFLLRPEFFPLSIGSEFIAGNKTTFALLWFGSLAILVSCLAYAHSKQRFFVTLACAYTISVSAFAYASLAIANNYWDQAVGSIVIGLFAILFTFENKLQAVNLEQRRGVLRSVAVFAVVLGIGTGAVFYLQAAFKDYVVDQNTLSVGTAQQVISSDVEDTEQSVSRFSKDQNLIKLMASFDKPQTEMEGVLRDFLLLSPTLRRVGLIDPNGKALGIYPQDSSFVGTDLADRQYFQEVKAGEELAVSDGIKPRAAGVPLAIVFATPIYGDDNRFLGAVFASLDLKRLSVKLNDIHLGENASLVVADKAGKIILSHDDKYLFQDAKAGSALSKGNRGQSGSLEGYDEAGRRSLQSFAPYDRLGWSIVAQQPLAEVAARNSSISLIIFLAALLVAVGSLVVTDRPTGWLNNKSVHRREAKKTLKTEAGFLPITVIVAITLLLGAIIGGSSLVRKYEQDNQQKIQRQQSLESTLELLDNQKLAGAELADKIIGTVALSDGGYSYYKLDEALVQARDIAGEAKLEFQNGDLSIFRSALAGELSGFKLKNGSQTTAFLQEPAATALRLTNGENIALRIIDGNIVNGRLRGVFKAQTYNTRHIIVGEVRDDGSLGSVSISEGGDRISDVAIFVAQRFLYNQLGKPVAQNVLGADTGEDKLNNIREVYANSDVTVKSLASELVYDSEKGTIDYKPRSSLVSADERLVITNGGNVNTLWLNLEDNGGALTLNSVDSSHIKDGAVSTIDIADQSITLEKLSSDISFGEGDITGVVAGSGLSGGSVSGSVTLSIGAGDGVVVAADSISLDINTAATTGETSSNSGLEVSADGLRLLGGCSNDEILKWNSATQLWACGADSSGGGGSITVEESDGIPSVNPTSVLQFATSGFTVTDSGGGTALVALGSSVLTAGNYGATLDPVYVNVGESPAAGDITGSFSGGLTVGPNAVALGTDTTGDYVASFTAGGGLTGNASGEGSTPTIAVGSANGGIVVNADNIALTLQASADALSTTTSSGSGLEILSGGLTLLQGCSDSQVLKWDETTDVWTCSTDAVGAAATLQSAYDSDVNGSDTLISLTTDDDTVIVRNPSLLGTDSGYVFGIEQLSAGLVDGLHVTNAGIGTLATLEGTGAVTISDGLLIRTTNVAGVLSDGIDVSDAEIVNAINIGANNILSNGTAISSAELNVLDAEIALGTETSGAYVSTITAGSGLTGDASGETSTPTLAVGAGNGITVAADSVTLDLGNSLAVATGLQVDANGLSLIETCADNELLKWTDAGGWACAGDTDTDTDTQGNGFTTIDTPAGTDPAADSSTDTLQFLATGSNLTITGANDPESLTFDISESTLAGNGLSASGDALVVNTGNGIQLSSDAVALGVLTADWNQTGAFDIVLNNSSSELKLLESGATPSLFAILDAGDLSSADSTFTFSGASGTVLTDANYTGTLDSVYVNVGESPAAGDITGSFSGGLTIGPNAVALGTDSTGDYVASFTAGNGLTGDASGEGSTPTINVVSANAGIAVTTGDIALDATVSGDALSMTTSAGSGLEIVSGQGLTLLQGCSDTQLLKWDETNDIWECSADTDTDTNNFEVSDGDKGDITVGGSGTSWAIDPDSVALTTDTTGNYVASANTSVLTGLTGGSSGSEGAALALGLDYSQALSGDVGLAANAAIFGQSGLIFEGATANLLETFIAVTDPTADRTITIPDRSGTLSLSGDTFTGDVTATIDTDGSTALTIAGNSVALTTDTTGNYTATIADAGNGTISVTNGATEGGAVTLDAIDLNCTNCIGATEITDLTLGTDTAGNYVSSATASGGLALTGAESASLGIDLSSADGVGGTSSGSGLELDANGVGLLQGCADTEILKWTDGTSTWACAADAAGGVTDGDKGDITVTGSGATWTIDADSVALTTDTTGNYVATITAGNGISGSSSSEGGTPTISLGALTADWNQTGGFDIVLNNSSSELKLLESGVTPTLFAILDAGDLSSVDSTFTFSGSSGTVLTDANYTGTLDSAYVNVGESPAAGDITGSFSGGLTVGPDSVALGTDTTGNYVASTNTSVLTGLTGGSAGSEGAALTIGLDYSQVLSGDVGLAANAAVFGQSGLVFEGATANLLETFIAVTDPTADRTITVPDRSGTVSLSGDTFTGDVTGTIDTDGSTVLTIQPDSVALTTDTTGNYVSSATASGGLTLTGTEGASLGIDLSSADGVGGTSSGSGLELDANGVGLLQGCADSEILKWTDGTSTWACATDTAGGVTDGDKGDITVTASGATWTIDPDSVALTTDTTGNYVASFSAGTGLTGDATGEGSTPTLSVNTNTGLTTSGDDIIVNQDFAFNWTTDHNFTFDATENILIANSGAGGGAANGITIQITPSSTAGTSAGLIVRQVSSAQTNPLDNGVVIENLDADLAMPVGIQFIGGTGGITDIFDVNGTLISAAEFNVLDAEIALGTETSGAYVSTITAGNGLTGDASGETSTPTLAVGAGNGISVAADAVAIQLLDAADGTGGTGSRSGLEFGDSGNNELALLQGCADGQILKWDDATDVQWECAADDTGGGGVSDGDKGDITVSSSGTVWTVDPDSVALGTDTTGNYVSGATSSGGLTLTGTEGATLGIDLSSADGAGATSSGSGMETDANGVGLLQGCSDEQVLKWNEASAIWECGSDRATVQIRKSADETVNNSSTLQNDNELTFPVGTNQTWIVQMNIQYTTPTAQDIKFAVTAPSGSTCVFGAYDSDEANVNIHNTPCATGMNMNTGGATDEGAFVTGSVVTTGTSGSITLQWAQVTAAVANTIVLDGSWLIAHRVDGADLAEYYYSRYGPLSPGTVVVADSSLKAGVKETNKPYDNTMVGVISTQPGLVLGSGADFEGGTPVALALSGRVPVKVNTENGSIKPGDLLTSSSTPGVAMRATKAGAIIGQALMGYDGDGVGEIIVFIKTSYGTGSGVSELANGVDSSSPDFAKNVLSQLMTNSEQLITQTDLSEVVTDRLVAGLEIITPELTTDRVALNSIESATAENIQINDDVVINGTLTVDKIKANQIEGLEVLASKFGKYEETKPQTDETAVAGVNSEEGTSSGPPEENQMVINSAAIALDLKVNGLLTADGGLTINGLAQFNGESIFDQLVTFEGKSLFNGDAEFAGRATFNSDSGGFALIKAGQTGLEVKFKEPFEQLPVVTLNIKNGLFAQYAYKDLTEEGFTIVLQAPLGEDVEFAWTALSIKDPQLSQNNY